jgi:glucose/arabinose dehydrogenase
VASEGLEGLVTGLLMHNGILLVSHKGKVSLIEDTRVRDILTGLPSKGDHQNNKIVLGPDGKIYLGQGTVTNSGIVGVDSYIFGWLPKEPQIHEIPCQGITLIGQNFETENPLTAADDKTTTGAYKPFGTPSSPGDVIRGDVKCGGSIVRFNPDGSGLELVAWGLRNPFGLRFDRNGQLWTTLHGADVRGSRNIFNDPDYLVRVDQGAWYGWPEYFDGEPVTAGRFEAPGKPKPAFLWREHPPVAKPFVTFSDACGRQRDGVCADLGPVSRSDRRRSAAGRLGANDTGKRQMQADSETCRGRRNHRGHDRG